MFMLRHTLTQQTRIVTQLPEINHENTCWTQAGVFVVFAPYGFVLGDL